MSKLLERNDSKNTPRKNDIFGNLKGSSYAYTTPLGLVNYHETEFHTERDGENSAHNDYSSL